MSQTAITLAFEQHLADVQMGGQPVIPDEFVLANIPDLDLATPIDRAAGLPSAGKIVHRQLVDQRGKVNANGVVYSIIMDTRIGDFTFNAMYLLHKASGLVAMVVHKESEDKLKNQGVTQPGNSLVKSMIMEYQGAAAATNTTIDASTWQIDFSARLFGLDRDIQQQAHDHYGAAAFMGDSLLVSAGTGVNEFIVAAGHGYIAGLRAELKQPHSMVVASRPATVYADVYHAGTLLSDWNTILTITASSAPLVDYVDQSGYQHYVTPLAQLAANGAVTDLRGRGGLWWHEQRPQAHTKDQVGLDKLENWGWSHSYTDATGGAGKYATGKAVADGYNALNSAKLNAASYTAADVLAKMLTVDGASSGLDADLLDGQHGDYYRNWGNLLNKPATMPPSSHTHPWAQIVDPPAQATRWPKWSEVTEKPPNIAGDTGQIATFAMTTPPVGWIKANGAAVSRTTYAALFAAIGTVYGVGNGTTTFNVPDLRGEFVRGWDNGSGIDSDRGFGTKQEDAIRNITGGVGGMRADYLSPDSGTGAFAKTTAAGNYNAGGAPLTNINFDASRVVPTANENRPRNIALLYCIKY